MFWFRFSYWLNFLHGLFGCLGVCFVVGSLICLWSLIICWVLICVGCFGTWFVQSNSGANLVISIYLVLTDERLWYVISICLDLVGVFVLVWLRVYCCAWCWCDGLDVG